MKYPEKLEIELARGFCTATCPMCSIEETMYNKSMMKFEKFKAIVDSFGEHIKKIKHVNLVGLGEVLLDKKLHHKIEYLKIKGVKHISFPSNASLLKSNTSFIEFVNDKAKFLILYFFPISIASKSFCVK